jgi:YrbI family 3-deoxy-D-manno-octulosonate 8-phosphate phosphatase
MYNNKIIQTKAKKIIYFFSDVDGTLTDGNTYYSSLGEELKKFSHIDGTGFRLLRNIGIKTGLITSENSEIVKRRSEKLCLKFCFISIADKLNFMSNFCTENNCNLDQIAYIGDDLNDLLLHKSVGLSFAPNNAHELIKLNSDYICKKNGGDGAFREAVEYLLNLKEVSIEEVFYLNN